MSDKARAHIEDITHTARQLHDAILHSLESFIHNSEDVVRGSAHALIALESKLRVAHVAGILPKETIDVFSGEIDSVLRGMNKYMHKNTEFVFGDVFPSSENEFKAHTPKIKKASTSRVQSSLGIPETTLSPLQRRDRIKTILEAKGMAGIKDIADVIKDVSEKTIQRELNSMIEDNVVKRHGERRWSKYSIL